MILAHIRSALFPFHRDTRPGNIGFGHRASPRSRMRWICSSETAATSRSSYGRRSSFRYLTRSKRGNGDGKL
jgi:hypothetical protein